MSVAIPNDPSEHLGCYLLGHIQDICLADPLNIVKLLSSSIHSSVKYEAVFYEWWRCTFCCNIAHYFLLQK